MHWPGEEQRGVGRAGQGAVSLACFLQFFCFKGTNGKGFDSRISDIYHPIAVLPALCGQRRWDSRRPQSTDGPENPESRAWAQPPWD